MPPKRRRRHQGLYYHSSPPKILSMIGSQSCNLKREDGRDGFVIKPSNIRIWIHDKDVKNLTKVIWAGEGNRLRSETSTNSRIKRYLENVPAVLNVIKDVHQCVIDNDLEALRMKTSYPVPLNLIKTKDANGLTVMHKAAGLGHTSIIEYLIIIWAEGATERDAMGRTPLHWSVSTKYNTRIYNLLVQAGAVEESLDNKMKTALDYKQKPSELDRTLLFVVPDAPRVPQDSQPDWNLLPDDESNSSTATKSNFISHRNSRDVRRGSDVVGNGMNLLTRRSRANSMDKGSESEQMYEGNDISNNTNDANEMQINKINNIENNKIDDTEIETNANALNGETETSTLNNQNSFEDNEQTNHIDNDDDDDNDDNDDNDDDNENQKKDNSIEPIVEQSDLNLNENAENTKVNDEGNDHEKEFNSNGDYADLKAENNEKNDKIENNDDNEKTVHENQENVDVNNEEEMVQDLEENKKDEVENDQSAEDKEKIKEKQDQNDELKIDNENGEIVNDDAEINNELENETLNENNENADENNKEDNENNEKDGGKSVENLNNKNEDNPEVENNEDVEKQDEEQEELEENSNEKENPNDENELKIQENPDDVNVNETTSTNDENVSNQSELSYSENDQEEQEQQEKLEEQEVTKEDETETDDNLKQYENHENELNELDNKNDKLQKQSSEELKIPPNKNDEENNEILENYDNKIENGNENDNDDNDDSDDVNDVDTNNNNHNEIKPKSAKSDGKIIENDDNKNEIGKNDENDKNKTEINGENGEEGGNDDDDDDDDDDQKNNTTTENMKKIDENHNALEIMDNSKELLSQPLEMAGFVHGDPDDNQVQSQSEGFEEDDEEKRIKRIIDSGDMEQLASLVLNGEGKKLLNFNSTQPEIQAFLDNVQNYMDKIRRVHKAARDGNLRDLQAALDRRKFAIAKDEISPDGASPLHVATVFGHAAIIRYLGGRFPETTTTIDNNGRTALHYAATINDNGHFYNLLTHLGANPKTEDKLENSAEFYRNHEEAKNIFSYRQLLKKFGANENLEEEMLSDQADDIKVEENANNSLIDNPIFHTEQGEYLASALGDPLVKGLTEVADKRPQDPVAYLANFLINFIKSKSNKNQKQVDDSDNIENNSNNNNTNTNGSPSTGRMSHDSATSQHQQEQQQPEDEKDEPPPTAEASDSTTTTPSSEERDEHGQSMLHFACARSHGRNALYNLIDGSQINITIRDELYRTARDVSLQAGQQANTKEIDKYVLTLAARGELKMFETMVLEGYDHILDIVDDEGNTVIDIARSRGHYELTKFLEEIQTFEENREELHQAIRDKDFEKVQELTALVDSFQLIRAKNYYGRTAVHIAILKEDEEIVEYLLNTCPAALKIGDNIERTPLHYAMGVNTVETISRILIKKGAKRTVKDLKGRQPTYYFMNKSDILRLQEEEEEDR